MEKTICVEPLLCFLLAVAMLIIPLPILFSWVVAATIHEIFHIAAICLFHINIHEIRLGLNGATICTGYVSPSKELLCAAAGPAGSFLLMLLSRWFPILSLCGLLQATYNLVPIYPMDGGRMLKSILLCFLPIKSADRVSTAIGFGAVFILFFLSAIGAMCFDLGLLPFMIAFLIAMRTGKIPCKSQPMRVQ